MKKLSILFIVLIMMQTTVFGAEKKYNIYVDNKLVTTDVEPENQFSTLFVPISFIAREMGATVDWHNPSVIINKSDTTVVLAWESNKVTKNGEATYTKLQPYLHSDRVYVPLRFISDQFNYKVEYKDIYDDATKMTTGNVYIDTKTFVDTDNSFVEDDSTFMWSKDGKYGAKVWTVPDYVRGKATLYFVKNKETGEFWQFHLMQGGNDDENTFWIADGRFMFSNSGDQVTESLYKLYNPKTYEFEFLFDADGGVYIESLNAYAYYMDNTEVTTPKGGIDYYIYDFDKEERGIKITKAEFDEYVNMVK